MLPRTFLFRDIDIRKCEIDTSAPHIARDDNVWFEMNSDGGLMPLPMRIEERHLLFLEFFLE